MVSLGLYILERKTTEVNCHVPHILSGIPAVYMLITVDVDFDHLAEVVCGMCAKFLYCKYTLFFLFHTALFGMKLPPVALT